MGAVFAIFAGFYFWVEKMLGIAYDELLGRIHFWTFFVGVNLTFFPMHFLGLAGMPRRISDYPDAYAGWNYIASLGSMISVVATLFFFYIVLNMFTVQFRITKRNPWRTYPTKLRPSISRKAAAQKGVSSIKAAAGLLIFDAPVPWQMNFQTPATEIMEKIVDLHHDIMFFLIVIVVFVSWMMGRIIQFYRSQNKLSLRVAFSHHTILEQVWTIIPTYILVLIAAPSFSLLYAIDALVEPRITVKVIGHQWYWTYETTNMLTGVDYTFDSYMLLEADLPKGGFRLLEVDNRLALPIGTNIRLLITAADVLHSWAIPAFGVKMDACPGRLNQVSLYIQRPGVFFGQCSELCGTNHSFMPIVVEAVHPAWYAPGQPPRA
jgi:heme/copper-type cytochrome/quinol oxidase subunit 2